MFDGIAAAVFYFFFFPWPHMPPLLSLRMETIPSPMLGHVLAGSLALLLIGLPWCLILTLPIIMMLVTGFSAIKLLYALLILPFPWGCLSSGIIGFISLCNRSRTLLSIARGVAIVSIASHILLAVAANIGLFATGNPFTIFAIALPFVINFCVSCFGLNMFNKAIGKRTEQENNYAKITAVLTESKDVTANCTICLNDIPTEPVVTPCKHTFCSECIHQWIQEHITCPLCRFNLLEYAEQKANPNSSSSTELVSAPPPCSAENAVTENDNSAQHQTLLDVANAQQGSITPSASASDLTMIRINQNNSTDDGISERHRLLSNTSPDISAEGGLTRTDAAAVDRIQEALNTTSIAAVEKTTSTNAESVSSEEIV